MKLSELQERINSLIATAPGYADLDVVVAAKTTNEPIMRGPMDNVGIDNATAGFDWNSGLFILWPEQSLKTNI